MVVGVAYSEARIKSNYRLACHRTKFSKILCCHCQQADPFPHAACWRAHNHRNCYVSSVSVSPVFFFTFRPRSNFYLPKKFPPFGRIFYPKKKIALRANKHTLKTFIIRPSAIDSDVVVPVYSTQIFWYAIETGYRGSPPQAEFF